MSTLSKSLLLNLKAGEKVHLVALKNPDGKFPYQGHFITFCASLVEKSGTNAAFVGKPDQDFPVLGIRAKCTPKVGVKVPEPSASRLQATIMSEAGAKAKAKAEAAKAKAAEQAAEAKDLAGPE